MTRRRVEIPWPLDREIGFYAWQVQRLGRHPRGHEYPETMSVFNASPGEIAGAHLDRNKRMDTRLFTLYGALWYAGCNPVIVDTRTGDVIG